MTTTSSTTNGPSGDRFERQRGLIPTLKLRGSAVTVIGVGAIGRQIALQLAALGIGRLQLVDFDLVEQHNVTSQGFWATEIGLSKVDAVRSSIQQLDPTTQVETTNDRFRPAQRINPIVFCCVDSISAREAIWRSVQGKIEFWVDGRMLGEVIRILAATSTMQTAYGVSLFAQSEAQTGSCTTRSTIYAASIAAGMMVHQLTRWLRNLPIDTDVCFNLLSCELTAS